MHKELIKQMKSDVILYQKLTHRAWVAKETINHNSWLIRLSEGVTNRANSVLPVEYNGSDLEKDLNIVEEMYKENDLSSVFQIPDYYKPSNLLDYLQKNGFQKTDETKLMTKEIKEEEIFSENDSFEYLIEDDVSEDWFQTLQRITNYNEFVLEAFRSIISRTSNTKVACSVMVNDITVGIVLGVAEKPFIGIYDLLIDPDYRRLGIGEFITKKMLTYAFNNNLKTMYLQVEAKNLPAVRLYEKLEFQERYRYRYMIKEYKRE